MDIFLQLYASPVKVFGTKPKLSTPKPRGPQPDIDDVYACVEPPPIPGSSAHLAENVEDIDYVYACVEPPPIPGSSAHLAENVEESDPLLPPPPPRKSYVDTEVISYYVLYNNSVD